MTETRRTETVRLTDSWLRALAGRLEAAPAERQEVIARDEVVPALKVRVSWSTISFVVVARRRRQFRGPVEEADLGAGKVVRVTLGRWPALSLARARRLANEAALALAEGRDPTEPRKALDLEAQAPTVGWCVERWTESPEAARLAPDTRREWTRILGKDILPAIGRRPAAALRRQDLAALFDSLAGPRGHLAKARHARAILRRVLRWSFDRGLIAAVPPFPPAHPEPRPRERTLSDLEIARLCGLASWRGPLGRAVALALLTGLRRGEILASRWEDVRWEGEQGWLVIAGARAKSGRAHRVPLVPLALELLGDRGAGPLFPTPAGRCPHPDSVGLRLVFRGAGLTASIHDVRRTVLSRIAAEWGLEAAAHVGGHVLKGVTARHYAAGPQLYDRVKLRALEWWAGQLEAIVRQGPPEPEGGLNLGIEGGISLFS